MRVLVVSGKGGVGKTTVAAATAQRAAALGRKTLVVSTDAAHSLADVLTNPVGHMPAEVGRNLFAQQVDQRQSLERSWADIHGYLAELLAWAGGESVSIDELLVVPGLNEVFALKELLDHARGGQFDCIVVDCAPTAETLRLLQLPEVLSWYLEKAFPRHRRLARLSRPVLRRTADMPIAEDRIFAAALDFMRDMEDVRRTLADRSITSVRLVTTPERVVVDEVIRLYAGLSLFGYAVDGVVINRVVPAEEVTEGLLRSIHDRQREQLARLDQLFGQLARPVALQHHEPTGLGSLSDLGLALFGQADPADAFTDDVGAPLDYRPVENGVVLAVRLPGYQRHEIDVKTLDSAIVVTAGTERRTMPMPEGLTGARCAGARYDGNLLELLIGRAERKD